MCAVMFALFCRRGDGADCASSGSGHAEADTPGANRSRAGGSSSTGACCPGRAAQAVPRGREDRLRERPGHRLELRRGKLATSKLNDYQKKKASELGEKNKALQAAQTKLQQGGSVLNDQARSQLEKEIEKMNRDIQFFQQDAQTEGQELQNQLQQEFQDKLNPVLEQVATEKGLHMVIDITNSGAVWANTGLDLTAEVIRRFDAASKTAPVKK